MKQPPHNKFHISEKITYREFMQRYWMSEALQEFCATHKLSQVGTKETLTERIANYLIANSSEERRHQKIENKYFAEPTKNKNPDSELGLSITSKVHNFKCDEVTKHFLQKEVKKKYGLNPTPFKLTVVFQRTVREQMTTKQLTYSDVIDIYYQCYTNSTKSTDATPIPSACQFNQFTQHFSNYGGINLLGQNPTAAWEILTQSHGQFNYAQYEALCTFIITKKLEKNIPRAINEWNNARYEFEETFFRESPKASFADLANAWNKQWHK